MESKDILRKHHKELGHNKAMMFLFGRDEIGSSTSEKIQTIVNDFIKNSENKEVKAALTYDDLFLSQIITFDGNHQNTLAALILVQKELNKEKYYIGDLGSTGIINYDPIKTTINLNTINTNTMETQTQKKQTQLKDLHQGDYVKLVVNDSKNPKTILKGRVKKVSATQLELESVTHLGVSSEQRYKKEMTLKATTLETLLIDKYPYQKFDYSELRFPLLGKTSEELGKENIALLLSGKETKLIEGLVKNNEQKEKVTLEASKLKLQRNDKGAIYLNITEKAEKLLIGKDDNNQLMGVDLSKGRTQLEEFGHLGLVKNFETNQGEKFDAYLSLDKETNKLCFMSKDAVTLQESIKGKVLSPAEKQALEQGQVVKIEGMKSKEGKTFNAYVCVDAVKKNISFFKPTDKLAKKYAVDLGQKATKTKSKSSGLKK